MARDTTFDHLKGQGSGAAVAVIAIIIVGVVVLFAGPQLGLNLNLGGIFGGGAATPIGVGPGTAGVVIMSFLATPIQIEGGDSATFTLTAVNNGGIDAKNIKYDIFGLSDSNSWSGKSSTLSGLTELKFTDPTRQIPGDTTTQEWESTSVKKNTDVTYPVTARVDYGYKTEMNLLVTLFGRDNVNVKNNAITQSTMSQVSSTVSPITITPKGTIPLVGKTVSDVRVSFDISNTGGGRNYVSDKTSGLDKVKVSATGCNLAGGQTDLKLINKVKTFSCTFKPTIDSTGQETKSIKIVLDYNYIVESTTNVKVLKQPEQTS